MIDFIDNENEAVQFIKNHLTQVTSHLDMIAKETGQVYVVMPADVIGNFAEMGARWGTWMIKAHKVCADRVVLALDHDEWMMGRHKNDNQGNAPAASQPSKPSEPPGLSKVSKAGEKLTPADIAANISEVDQFRLKYGIKANPADSEQG